MTTNHLPINRQPTSIQYSDLTQLITNETFRTGRSTPMNSDEIYLNLRRTFFLEVFRFLIQGPWETRTKFEVCLNFYTRGSSTTYQTK